MAQFAVLIYDTDSARTGGEAEPRRAENDEHAHALTASGSMLLAYALTPRAHAASIREDTATTGVLNDTGQVVVGFYVLEADDLEAAVSIARQNPAARHGAGGVEVRPVDSGGITTP